MSGFKLLAIRPLVGCNQRFLKNLKEGIIYKFYQEYLFTDTTGKEITFFNNNLKEKEITVKIPENSIDIYSSENVNINVSTIVGENGSGKSSIIDFFNTICYFLGSYQYKTMSLTSQVSFNELKHLLILTVEYLERIKKLFDDEIYLSKKEIENLNENELKGRTNEIIKYINDLHSSYFIKINSNKEIENDLIKLFLNYGKEGNDVHSLNCNYSFFESHSMLIELNNKLIQRIRHLEGDYNIGLKFDDDLKNSFNFQLFYEKGNIVYCIKKDFDKISIPDENFFYSILLNYSIHSLNSNIMGKWIFNLFHKNDGYQTPLVINPYREEGVINVNRELKLSIDRLFFNIIEQLNYGKDATILSKYKFNRFILKRKIKDSDRYPLDELKIDIEDESNFLSFIADNPPSLKFYDNKNILDYSLGYLIKKFRRMSNTYMRHFYIYKEEQSGDLLDRVEKLKNWQNEKILIFLRQNKNNHVTRKFFQTYNFLKNFEKLRSKLDFINDWDLDGLISISNDEIILWIAYVKEFILSKGKEVDTDELILNLFPNIFEIDIEFIKDGKEIKLSDMSSGEQQYIFNIQTITYHINNLKTIKESKESDSKIKSYNDVNIILDEVELYYHPQFQRQMVKDLIDSIKVLKGLKKTNNFNILFLTHSPFILSDIPSNNILRLIEGEPEKPEIKEQSFGANIYDLLDNDFFMKNGFIGEYAMFKIKEVLDYIHENKYYKEKHDYFLKITSIIGDEVINEKLNQLLDNLYSKSLSKIDFLKQKQKEIENQINKLEGND